MGKTGGNSWLTAVKRAFRSPTKGTPKKGCKRREEHGQEYNEEEKKAEKRRWIFRKHTSHTQSTEINVASNSKPTDPVSIDQQRSAITQAEAGAPAAKAVLATAQAAVKRVGETRPVNLVRQHYAALVLQTAFRGYLARKALCALKGIVKLQALVRGHNVRKQAKATLKCMQALIRVQAKIRDQCSRHSHDGSRKSMFAESNNLWDKYKDLRERKSISRDGNDTVDHWENRPHKIEDIETILQRRKEAALNREKTLAYALSQQIQRSHEDLAIRDEKEAEENTEWLSQWMEFKQYWENDYRLTTQRRGSTKTVDMKSLLAHLTTPINCQQSHQNSQNRRHSLHVASPLNMVHNSLSHQSPSTPSMCNTRTLQVRSASPQCLKGCRSHSTTSTPSLRSNNHFGVSYRERTGPTATTPNYMAATESARARTRTQSTPKQRFSSSDRERGTSVKKRLSYPIPEPDSDRSIYTSYSCFSQDLKSPSFRSVQGGIQGLERGSLFSCYTESTGGEVSPASTSHMRRWLS